MKNKAYEIVKHFVFHIKDVNEESNVTRLICSISVCETNLSNILSKSHYFELLYTEILLYNTNLHKNKIL